MAQTLIFWPAFAQVVLTIVVMAIMGVARAASIKRRGQTAADVAMNRPEDWDEQALKLSNNFKNQFEMPVVFFAAIGLAAAFKIATSWFLGLAWLFVIARMVQTAIHIGPNMVEPWAAAYLVGVAAVFAMWIDLALAMARAP